MLKKFYLITGMILISVQSVYAAASGVSPELENSLKSNANDPNPMTIIFALCFVIFLIYITGIIYSKLNLVGAKTVKEQLRRQDLTKAVVVSTTQLGQNKNLHVIELNGKCYLIGATQNSITMLKELDEISSENTKKTKKESNETKVKDENTLTENMPEADNPEDEENDIYKKYL